MNCLDLLSVIKCDRILSTKYVGCYLRDRLPNPTNIFLKYNNNFFLIVNTVSSTSSEEIGHWILLYVRDDNIYFFDSFGRCIEDKDFGLSRYIKDYYPNKRLIHVITYPVQHDDSLLCGAYVIYVAYKLSRDESPWNIKQSFSRFNRKNNDMKMEAFIKKLTGNIFKCNTNYCPSVFNMKCKDCQCIK